MPEVVARPCAGLVGSPPLVTPRSGVLAIQLQGSELGFNMTNRSRGRSLAAGACCLAAAATALLSTSLTWLQGGTYVGDTATIVLRMNLWQMERAGFGTSSYAITFWLVVAGAVTLVVTGVNELGLPLLRWFDRWRWAPALIGTTLVAVGALRTEPPVFPSLWWHSSLSMGPGKWVCVVGAALGAAATIAIVLSVRSRSSGDNEAPDQVEDLTLTSG